MIRVSKNIALGEPLDNYTEIVRLSKEGKSVVEWSILSKDSFVRVRPAAFYVNWPLNKIVKTYFFHAVKIKQ